MLMHANKMMVIILFLSFLAQSVLASDHFIAREVEFETEDGWTISATLRLPAGTSRNNPVSAMILTHEKEHDRLDAGDNDTEFALRLPIEAGIATLAFDWRGTEKSMGKNQPIPDEGHNFSTNMRERMYLDVVAAMQFLAELPEVDRLRIGIAATQFSAEHAVRAMQETPFIPTRALVLMGGENLSQKSKDFLAGIDIPIYVGASILDKPVFGDMAEVYVRAKNENSHMIAPLSAGRGYNLLLEASLRGETLATTELDNLMFWLGTQVRNLGNTRAVSFETRDGWTINGNFRYPDNLGKNGELVPGVIQVSGARSNRFSMYRFEEEMARRGFAVLSIELRGRGASMGGQAFDAPGVSEVRENILASPFELDTKGAIDFLATTDGIDPNRIAIIGEARGSRSALLAAEGDNRIKAMILISVYQPDERMEQALSQLDIPILFIDGETNWAAGGTRYVHRLSKKGELMIYPGLGHSHHLRYFHPQMVGFMGDFMERELPLEPRLMRLPSHIIYGE